MLLHMRCLKVVRLARSIKWYLRRVRQSFRRDSDRIQSKILATRRLASKDTTNTKGTAMPHSPKSPLLSLRPFVLAYRDRMEAACHQPRGRVHMAQPMPAHSFIEPLALHTRSQSRDGQRLYMETPLRIARLEDCNSDCP
jgi:hypothetical protein